MIRLSEMPLILQKAVVAGEDALFTNTRAMRPDAMISTIRRTSRRRARARGSTITMQLVRNAEEATGVSKSARRRTKLRMIAALQVEREFTKDEILELYLNQVYFGGSAHGVEAAAQTSCRARTCAQEGGNARGTCLRPCVSPMPGSVAE